MLAAAGLALQGGQDMACFAGGSLRQLQALCVLCVSWQRLACGHQTGRWHQMSSGVAELGMGAALVMGL